MGFNRRNFIPVLALGGLVAAVGGLVWAQQPGDALVIEKPADGDVYAAHRAVDLRSTVDGDFVSAGRVVNVDGVVSGDVIVAAQEINVRSNVNDDVRAAGQHVRVTAPVSGHVVAVGQTVTISEAVGDWAWLAGNTVEVLANVGGDLKIRARKITINADIAGNINAVGNDLQLGPNAVVRGDLKWHSDNKAEISPEAQIDGEFIEEPSPGLAKELSTASTYTLPLSTIVAVIVLFVLFSRPMREIADRIDTHPAMSLALGIGVLGGAPLLAILLLFSGIGVWLGLAVLGIFLVVLLLGWLTGLYAASDLLLRRLREQPALWQALAAIFATVVAVSLLAKVPLLGFVLVTSILVIGIGALCAFAWKALRSVEFGKLQPLTR